LKWKAALEDPALVAAFGWDSAEVAVVLAFIIAFLTACTAYEQVNSSRNRLIKDEARETAEHGMEVFANTSIRYNRKMKEEDKQDYGIHPPDYTPTPVTAPDTYPEAEADTSIIR
jgi:hypothetical protein